MLVILNLLAKEDKEMENISYKILKPQIKEKNKKDIGIFARTVSIYFILTMCGLYVIPSSITNLIKPLFIYLLMLEILILNKSFNINCEHWISLLLILYFSLIFLRTGVNSFNFKRFAPLFLNLTFFILATIVEYNQKEIILLVNSLYWGGAIFSFIVAISNPIISNNISRININYFKNSLNANGIPYLIVPCVVIGFKKLFSSKYRGINKLITLFMILIMLYTIFYTSTRGAFLALFISLIMIVSKHILDNLNKGKIVSTLLFIIFVFSSILIILYLLPENIASRMFDFTSYDVNRRDILWDLAIYLSKDNFYFGNGFDYWTRVTGYLYGAHNLYIDLLVSSGIFGSILMFLLVGIILFKSRRNVFLLALLSAPIMNSFFESGLTYDFWNPLILCAIIYSYTIVRDSRV
ncbi:O-antigen ligase family protein [Anaerosalibacter bizertensis]|uniref:O-antigen ligase family protein n=1 Tax=Anaerosalibacter bizertensis TaxID=932217 RepID=UPI001C0EBEC3|nr:O-antigen ligase family protein [Anaerosalibacter bizertensis]MBU5294096.1 O-antigen ligase family protein [Anaerosalibacter bizertensis]